MPNQLAQSKKRMTLAEQTAVLAALDVIAKAERTTVTDILRQAARKIVAERASLPQYRDALRKTVESHAPSMPKEFRSPAKLAKFKREQRNHDLLLQELNLIDSEDLQLRNSLVRKRSNIRLTTFAG